MLFSFVRNCKPLSTRGFFLPVKIATAIRKVATAIAKVTYSGGNFQLNLPLQRQMWVKNLPNCRSMSIKVVDPCLHWQ
jgi:hypothetical protein